MLCELYSVTKVEEKGQGVGTALVLVGDRKQRHNKSSDSINYDDNSDNKNPATTNKQQQQL